MITFLSRVLIAVLGTMMVCITWAICISMCLIADLLFLLKINTLGEFLNTHPFYKTVRELWKRCFAKEIENG